MDTTEPQTTQNMDVNIYDDVAEFDLGEEVEKLKAENQMLGDHIKSLEEDIEKLTRTIIKLKETQDALTKNISSLFLTAKTEIGRKDRMIADLRTEIDNMRSQTRNVDLEYSQTEIGRKDRMIADLTTEIDNMRSQTRNVDLEYSQTEIERKDQIIADLRTEIDNMRSQTRNVDLEYKRKDRENSPTGSNISKRFKCDRLDDKRQDRGKSRSRYSPDRYSTNSIRSRSQSRERVYKHWNDRGRRFGDRDRRDDEKDRRAADWEKRTNNKYKWNSEIQRYVEKNYHYRDSRGERTTSAEPSESRSREEIDKYSDDRGRRYDDRDRRDDERDRMLGDWEKSSDNKYKWNSEMQRRYADKNYHYRDFRSERMASVEILESGGRERIDKYSDDRGQRFDDRYKRDGERDGSVGDWDKNADDEYKGNSEMQRYADKNCYYGDSRSERMTSVEILERSSHPRRDPPLTLQRDESQQKSCEESETRDKSRSEEHDKEKLEDKRPVAQTSDSQNTVKEKPVSEKQKVDVSEHPKAVSQVPTFENKVEKSNSKEANTDKSREAKAASENKNVKNKPRRKRLKMLDVIEENLLNKKVKRPSKSLISELESNCQVISDRIARDSKQLCGKNIKYGKNEKLEETVDKAAINADSTEKDGKKNVKYKRIIMNTDSSEENIASGRKKPVDDASLKIDLKDKELLKLIPEKHSAKEDSKRVRNSKTDSKVMKDSEPHFAKEQSAAAMILKKESNKCVELPHEEKTCSKYSSKQKKEDAPSENHRNVTKYEGVDSVKKKDTNDAMEEYKNEEKDNGKVCNKDQLNSGVRKDANSTAIRDSKDKKEDEQPDEKKDEQPESDKQMVGLKEGTNEVAGKSEKKVKETDERIGKGNKTKKGLTENTNTEDCKKNCEENRLDKRIDGEEKGKVGANSNIGKNNKEKKEDKQSKKEGEAKGELGDVIIIIEDCRKGEKETSKQFDKEYRRGPRMEGDANSKAKEEGSEKGKADREKEDTRSIKSKESVNQANGSRKNEETDVKTQPVKEDTRNLKIKQDGNSDINEMKKDEKKVEEEGKGKVGLKDIVNVAENGADVGGQFAEKDKRDVRSNQTDNNVRKGGEKEKMDKLSEKEEKGRRDQKTGIDNSTSSCKGEEKEIDKQSEKTSRQSDDKSNNIMEMKNDNKKAEEEGKMKVDLKDIIDATGSHDNADGQSTEEGKGDVRFKEENGNVAKDCKKEKRDKLPEREEKGTKELKAKADRNTHGCKNEKEIDIQSEKTDKQREDISNNVAGDCNDKRKDNESEEKDKRELENVVEGIENEEKKISKQSKGENRRQVELKENVSNVIRHYKNEGSKAGKGKASTSSNTDLDLKGVREDEKEAENAKGTDKGIEKSSAKDESSVTMPEPKAVAKKLPGDKISVASKNVTENATKAIKNSANVCTRRRSSKESVKEYPLETKDAVDEKLGKDAVDIQKDVQNDVKVPFEKVGSKNEIPVNPVGSQTDDKEKNNIKDKGKVSGDGKKSSAKETKKTETLDSTKPKKPSPVSSRTVPKRNASRDLNKKVNNTRTVRGQTATGKECTKTDGEVEKKTEDLSKTTKCSLRSVTVASKNVNSVSASSIKKNNEPSVKGGRERNVVKKQDPKKQKSGEKTSEPKVLDLSSTSQTLKSNRPEIKIDIIDYKVLVNEKSGRDLLKMAMEGLIDADESKVGTSKAVNPKLDPVQDCVKVPNRRRSIPRNVKNAENNNVAKDSNNRNENKQTEMLEQARKKVKTDDISTCLQTSVQVSNQGKTNIESASSTPKLPETSVTRGPTKQTPKFLQETATLNNSSNKGSIDTRSKSNQSCTPDKKVVTRRRITPTPVKDNKPRCSFENILEKSSQSSSFSTLPAISPLHLTHEGEIPVLHLEENHISSLPTETNINNKNILSLLDTMNISNIECELPKFKSSNSEANSGPNLHDDNLNVSPIKGNSNLTFKNIISKVTSTPTVPISEIQCKGNSVETASDNQNFGTGSVADGLAANTVVNSSAQAMTSSFPRRRRKCRLVIRD